MTFFKKLIIVLAFLPALSFAGSSNYPLDRAPDRSSDLAALQNGAKLFVNYCLNCHSASFMRYNRLTDLGLTEQQIKDNLLFTSDKVGDLMTTVFNSKDASAWFGVVPPDLSVIARSRASGNGSGADYLYTYLRTYYQDEAQPTGWNNLVFPHVGMPHVLWELQGVRKANFVDEKDPHDASKTIRKFAGFEQVKAGKLSSSEYDTAVADLVAYLQWMGEPVQNTRQRLGAVVLIFLGLFFVLAWRLSASYWKDIK
jgi:ubiquinol-cytochrome c reductase cytochrome c1 subunit